MRLFALLLCLATTNAFYFFINGNERKCFYKELSKGTVLVGNYAVETYDPDSDSYNKASSGSGVIIDVEEVFDDDHRVVHQKGQPAGEFTFSALDSGDHRICFQPQSEGWLAKLKTKITIDFALGDEEMMDSKKRGKVQSLSEKVRTLNTKVMGIRLEQKLMREREAQFRDLSESTNSGAVNWAIFQLIAFGATCVWQVKHLRSFFVKQKIV